MKMVDSIVYTVLYIFLSDIKMHVHDCIDLHTLVHVSSFMCKIKRT